MRELLVLGENKAIHWMSGRSYYSQIGQEPKGSPVVIHNTFVALPPDEFSHVLTIGEDLKVMFEPIRAFKNLFYYLLILRSNL